MRILWLIDFVFRKAKSHFNIDQSYWAEPSQSHLRELLLEVYLSTTAEINKKTNLAKKFTNNLTWQSVAKKNIDFVKYSLSKYHNKYFKLGILSTWNSKCGIACYVQSLVSDFNQEVSIFCPVDLTVIGIPPSA